MRREHEEGPVDRSPLAVIIEQRASHNDRMLSLLHRLIKLRNSLDGERVSSVTKDDDDDSACEETPESSLGMLQALNEGTDSMLGELEAVGNVLSDLLSYNSPHVKSSRVTKTRNCRSTDCTSSGDDEDGD